MKKQLTQAQIDKRKEKEAKELVYRRKQGSIERGKKYIIMLMIVMTLAYLVDEVTTNITGALQSNIIVDFFNVPMLATGLYDYSSAAYTNGLAQFASVGMIIMLFQLLLPFYKSLADIYGRKILLTLNTIGMGIGMLIIVFASNFTLFLLGYLIICFVTPTDMHSLYFMETAPPKHRVKIALGAKALAILGISGIGVLRLLFLDDSIATSWRNVYIVPVILAVIIGVMILLFARETPQFVNNRIELLETPLEKRLEDQKNKTQENKKSGVLTAFKFAIKHRQLKWLLISGGLLVFSSVVPGYYNAIMTQGGMTTNQISYVVIAYPFIYSVVVFLGGIISDKFGRKVMTVLYASLSIAMLCLFIFISNAMDNGVVAGLTYGLYVGFLWGSFDSLLYVMVQESSPTHLRASCLGVISLVGLAGGLFATLVYSILVAFLPVWQLAIGIAVVGTLTSVILIIFKVHETKNVDLGTVTGTEWD